jgi:hypothetical protein
MPPSVPSSEPLRPTALQCLMYCALCWPQKTPSRYPPHRGEQLLSNGKEPEEQQWTGVGWGNYFRMITEVDINNGSAGQVTIGGDPYNVADPMGNNLIFVPHN